MLVGKQNNFLGELQDAGELGTLALPLFIFHSILARKSGSLEQRFSRVIPRIGMLSSALLVAFGLCSLYEIDYRRYGLHYSPAQAHPKDCPSIRVEDFRTQRTAEKRCKNGLIFGALSGAAMKLASPVSRHRLMTWILSGWLCCGPLVNATSAVCKHGEHMFGHFKD